MRRLVRSRSRIGRWSPFSRDEPDARSRPPGPITPSGPSGFRRSSATSSGPGLARHCPTRTVRAATDEELLRVHTPRPPRRDRDGSTPRGAGLIEADTWVSPGSTLAALLAAGAAVDAVTLGDRGPGSSAPSAWSGRPGIMPGPTHAMGFCLLRQRRRRRGRCRQTGIDAGPNPDRRLRRPPRERHPGDLLRRPGRRVPLDPPLSVLSRHGRGGRDRDRARARGHSKSSRLPLRDQPGRLSRRLPIAPRTHGRSGPTRAGPHQRGVRRPRRGPRGESRAGGRGLRRD